MPIEFACPSCQRQYRVKDELAGKSAKCGKCGHRMPIPQLAGASAGSSLGKALTQKSSARKLSPKPKAKPAPGTGSWLDEELEASQSKVVKPPQSSLPPCPGCGKALANDAVVCVACGYDKRSHKKLETKHIDETAPHGKGTHKKTSKVGFGLTLLRGSVFSFLGAMLGAVIWAVFAYLTFWESGIIAWGLGGLAGLGMALGHDDENGTMAGIIAAFMSVMGIIAAKVFIVVLFIGMAVAGAVAELDELENADPRAMKTISVAADIAEEKLKAQGLDSETASEDQWDEAYAQAETEVAALDNAALEARFKQVMEKHAELDEDVPNEGALAQQEMDEVEIPGAVPNELEEPPAGIGGIVGSLFSPIDGLWILLAFFTAYKVGSGQATD